MGRRWAWLVFSLPASESSDTYLPGTLSGGWLGLWAPLGVPRARNPRLPWAHPPSAHRGRTTGADGLGLGPGSEKGLHI